MSTSIHNGFRFTTPHLTDIHNLIMGWRQEVVKLSDKYMSSLYAREITDAIDMAVIKGEPIPARPARDVRHEIYKAQREIETTGLRNPRYDLDFDISIMPFEGQVYGIVFCEQSKWTNAFMKQPWVERWPYWNNTDRPSNVRASDWEARGRVWDAIFEQGGSYSAPAQVGFNASCTVKPHLIRTTGAKILRHIPKLESRANRVAAESVRLSEIMKSPSADVGMDKVMARLWKADSFLQSDEGKTLITAESERLLTVLPKITLEMIVG